MTNFTDAQALSLVQNQSYKINQTVYETRFPDWDFGRLVYVDTSGPEWSPGIVTYTDSISGKANWVTAYEKDMPKANVSQDFSVRNFQLAGIGYDFNYEEVNTALNMPNGTLPDRRARAARKVYTKFMYDLTLKGSAEKGLGGLINYGGVLTSNAPADGTGGSTYWVNEDGVGQKTPQQIIRDVNIALQGINYATYEIELANTILLPSEAYNYIATTTMSATNSETILSFLKRTNIYTDQTGQLLTIRTVRELSTQAAGGKGRMVVYKNDQDNVKLLLPMPHKFLPVYQDGWGSWQIPGVFRTGGLEVLTTAAFRYLDLISEPPVPA